MSTYHDRMNDAIESDRKWQESIMGNASPSAPAPWKINSQWTAIVDADGRIVTRLSRRMKSDDVRRIVLCVNAHDYLLTALREFCAMPSPYSACWLAGCACHACRFSTAQDEARAAIAKAEGRA